MISSIIPTDKNLRSQLEYGKANFPFSCYVDHLTTYGSPCIEWHWHNEFEFSFVKEGSATCHIGGNCIELCDGDGIFINSKVIHRFETTDKSSLINYIFSPEFIAERSSIIYTMYIQPFLVSELEYEPLFSKDIRYEAAAKTLEGLHSIIYSSCFGREIQIRNLISKLWLCFAEKNLNALPISLKSQNKVKQVRLHEMIMYIHANYQNKINLNDISSAANISKSEALRCFNSGLEMTPIRYLNEYRLARAAEILLSSSVSVAFVAETCGFETAGYFCKVFKDKYGVSPNSFRKSNQMYD